ncbi:BQ2448_2510 [Microbotryum intermedium]|uniref:E3 ubiquitin-protein ligase listerin n=1 Tax=Microbotryum intermedium TaxID=269621 RepID=A0A238F6J4_9BASI|nr:BQ2448_2510 [Microbotryum intermedium]
MAKSKSSASSGTRKKNAAKKKARETHDDEGVVGEDGSIVDAKGPGGTTKQSMQRGQKKDKKDKKDRFAPKVKSYIPPPPPPKGAPDPVDLWLAGGSTVDAELVVVLRRLAKKDEATILKGIEGLEMWVRQVVKDEAQPVDEDEQWKLDQRRDDLTASMDVWHSSYLTIACAMAHHFHRISLYPSRRLRLQAHALHQLLTSKPRSPSKLLASTRSKLLAPSWLEQKDYVGSWCCSAFDGDRAVRSAARRSWDSVVLPNDKKPALEAETEPIEGIDLQEHAENILDFAAGLILTPASEPKAGDELDDPSLLKTQALLATSSLLSTLPLPLPLSKTALDFLTTRDLWQLTKSSEPAALRRALYELLGAATGRTDVELLARNDGIRTIAHSVLKECWDEDEGWAGIISFLRRYPQAWTLADEPGASHSKTDDEDSTSDGSDSESEDEDQAEQHQPADSSAKAGTTSKDLDTSPGFSSPTLNRLFSHLALACTGRPQNYPTILLLLSTIPPRVLPPSQTNLSFLFESFWAAWGGRALSLGSLGSSSGPNAIEQFVTSFLECFLFELARLQKEGEEHGETLVIEWIGRTWRTFLGLEEDSAKRHGGISTPSVATQIALTLNKISIKDKQLFDEAWAVISESSLELVSSTGSNTADGGSLSALATAITAFNAPSMSDALKARTRALTKRSVESAVTVVMQDERNERVPTLLTFIGTIKESISGVTEVQKILDELAATKGVSLVSSDSNSATMAYFTSHLSSTSEAARNAIWTSLFQTTPSNEVLLKLVDAVSTGELSSELPSAVLDDYVLEIARRVLGEDTTASSIAEFDLLTRLMVQPQPFIAVDTPAKVVDLIAQILPARASHSLALTPSAQANRALASPCRLIAQYSQFKPNVQGLVESDLAIAIFEVAHLLPNCRLEHCGIEFPDEAVIAAQYTWTALLEAGSALLANKVYDRIGKLVLDTSVRPSPIELVECAATHLNASDDVSTLARVLPDPAAFDKLVETLAMSNPSPLISILHPLVPQSGDDSDAPRPIIDTDAAGFSTFARSVVATLEVAARNRTWLRTNSWVLPHVLLLGDVARDELAAFESTRGVFGPNVPEDVLERIVASCDGASSFLLSAKAADLPSDWHTKAVMHLRKKDVSSTNAELVSLLDALARRSNTSIGVHWRRAFSTVLQAILRYADAGVADAERWLAFAQNLGETIIYSIKDSLIESPRFERYQNELAANLAGVPPSAASGKGLAVLRVLLATAPPADAPVIFLPQQRSMFLIQSIQRWIASDEDLAEEIHTAVAELFIHLSPIIQDMSGSHWDLMFDIIEFNLEVRESSFLYSSAQGPGTNASKHLAQTASWDDNATLPSLYHSCRLILTIQDLASRNKDLRAIAKERINTSLAFIRDLFVSRPDKLEPDSQMRNQPRLAVLETMARLMRNLPPTLLTMGKPFDQLLRLLRDPSLAIQQSSYSLVTRIAAQHVSDFVVEVELDQEGVLKGTLPDSLIQLLSDKLPGDVLLEPQHYARASTLLHGWLIAFTFFDQASPRLKADYTNHLRKLELVGSSYLPSLFALLNLSDRTRTVDVSPWGIDEFHLELVDDLTPITLPAFATFVYYCSLQAIPSLIRQWWEGCKNRQLSIAVANLTSRHFSPVLIAHELAHLRDPNDPAGKALRDNDDFTVKVAAAANEVKAVFVVDEESMEIGVRMPADFPLQQVEVKDVRRVGVTDSQWRAWLLSVQQVITNQNGLIAEALSLWKRNVSLHFEGVEACAICYSSISVVDRSLPTKACKTCNNRFHAGCLYKWFSTSHGSSCPLCRSLF